MTTSDRAYSGVDYEAPELDHEYGDAVHLMRDPVAWTRLAEVCSPAIGQPEFNGLIEDLYRRLLWAVVGAEFPTREAEVSTRMRETTDRGVYRGTVVAPDTSVVTVDVARAGMVPSEVCYRRLSALLDEERVRQDHLFAARQTNEEGDVVGAEVAGDKVGGPIDGGFVLIPDPMGATGSSMSEAIDFYREEVGGSADQMVAMNLIVTPEYIRRLTDEHPDVVCYAMRLDRGMSPEEIFETVPGERWSKESGLDDNDYIVPGGGGFGELMNNSWT